MRVSSIVAFSCLNIFSGVEAPIYTQKKEDNGPHLMPLWFLCFATQDERLGKRCHLTNFPSVNISWEGELKNYMCGTTSKSKVRF